MKYALVLLLVLSSAVASAGELDGVFKNNEGVRRFGKNQRLEAFDAFTGALAEIPDSVAIHLNIGDAFLLGRENEKALSEYQQVIRATQKPRNSAEREARFYALFNSAVALTDMKKIDEALATYQAALEVKPDSVETKTNMELLTAGGGGGEGEGQNQDKSKDGKDDKDGQGQKKDDKRKDQPQKFENPRSTPKPFKSEDLSQQDVKRILEEMKRQEEQIRARMQNEQQKDVPPAKDW